jgi:hypothetical protein
MGAQDDDHRGIINAQGGVYSFREECFSVTFQQLFGAAEPSALAGGQEDDGGMGDVCARCHNISVAMTSKVQQGLAGKKCPV